MYMYFATHTCSLLILPVHLSQSSVCEGGNQYVISEEGGIQYKHITLRVHVYMYIHVYYVCVEYSEYSSMAMCNVEKDVPVF